MSSKQQFDKISVLASRLVAREYSTSFSHGIANLDQKFHGPIYSIYGFVRFADEIVDTFHAYDQKYLLQKFRKDCEESLRMKISLNPILNSFQQVVHQYGIGYVLIENFFQSMEMDLCKVRYDRKELEKYIHGSAESVGLMCLRVFSEGSDNLYESLKPYATSLGSAFQKVNFLRDANADFAGLGRVYFPDVDLEKFTQVEKQKIEKEIELEFEHALKGIRMLPNSSRRGVYLAYNYYRQLFRKICGTPASEVLKQRVRIENHRKVGLMVESFVRHQLDLI